MVNVRAPLMLLLLLLGSFLFRLWNMSQVFNACRMHSLPLTTECSALAREKERASQRDSDCELKWDSRRMRRDARFIHMFAIKCLWDCISPTQFLIFLSVFFTFVTNALDTHSWAHIRTAENFTISCIWMWLLKSFVLWDIAMSWEQNWNVPELWKKLQLIQT